MTAQTARQATKRSRPTEAVAGLNHNLALAADLWSQVKQANWNVVGPSFIALHRLFDEQAEILLAHVDLFAERMRALRGVARGTIPQAAAESPLPDLDARALPEDEAARTLLERFATYSPSLSAEIEALDKAGDPSTQDINIEAQRQLDLHAYFGRSHLGASSGHA